MYFRLNSKMKLLMIFLYMIYMILLLVTHWKPSLYNVFIDTLEFLVTESACVILFMYHDSIEQTKKTILNFQMQVIAVSFGGIYVTNLIRFIPFNIFPAQSLEVLKDFPSQVCFVLQGDLVSWMFFINLVLVIVLHALFRTFPYKFLSWNENNLKKGIFVVNFMCLSAMGYDIWIKKRAICSKVFFFQLKNKLDLDVDDDIPVYFGSSKVSLLLCLVAGLTTLITKMIRVMKSRKNKIVPKLNVIAVQSQNSPVASIHQNFSVNSFDDKTVQLPKMHVSYSL